MPDLDRTRDTDDAGIATEGTNEARRLRALLRAHRAVVEDIDLPSVLRRIVDSAVELVGAEFGAIGVIGADGSLDEFIHTGVSDEQAAAIGHLPRGLGLLGALIAEPSPIRLDHLSGDPRSTGFPHAHPPMDAFLGVPIRVRDQVFGNLYLANARGGSFTSDDENLIVALAAAAGVAIENARLLGETRLRQRWAHAAAEMTAAILSADDDDVIGVVASRILDLADADLVGIVFPTDDADRLTIGVARGAEAEQYEGRDIHRHGSISGSVLDGRQPRVLDSIPADDAGMPTAGGPVLAVPLLAASRALGVLVVTRTVGRPGFTAADVDMVSDFAAYVSVAMELSAARADRQRMALLEDRGRIARDLHDHVIQELFATGLTLHQVGGSTPSAASRISEAVDGIDRAISHIRTVIFALTARTGPAVSVRHQLLDLAGELAPIFVRTPNISFSGAVDLIVTDDLATDIVAVSREALTNVARHADAANVSLRLTAAERSIVLEVSDSGRGFPADVVRSGVANMQARAEARSGSLTITSEPGDTRVTWTVPLPRRFRSDDR